MRFPYVKIFRLAVLKWRFKGGKRGALLSMKGNANAKIEKVRVQ